MVNSPEKGASPKETAAFRAPTPMHDRGKSKSKSIRPMSYTDRDAAARKNVRCRENRPALCPGRDLEATKTARV